MIKSRRRAPATKLVRTYVVDPYTQVRDERTGLVTAALRATLDGQLDPFLKAARSMDA